MCYCDCEFEDEDGDCTGVKWAKCPDEESYGVISGQKYKGETNAKLDN